MRRLLLFLFLPLSLLAGCSSLTQTAEMPDPTAHVPTATALSSATVTLTPSAKVKPTLQPDQVALNRLQPAQQSSSAQIKAAQAESAARSKAQDSEHTKWIDKSLREMKTVKVGMTRAQLTKVFTTEGGLSSREWRRYVYRECPYIKVDVVFKPVGISKRYPHRESHNDVITKISQPFLEWSIMA